MKRRVSGGYTIMEVMIVLTVSAVLFSLIAVSMSGRQGKTEAQQALRALESKVQTVTGEVSSGYYPTGLGFKCVPAAGDLLFSASPNAGGSNYGCIFLGKVMSFNNTNMDILTVLGHQYLGGGTVDVDSLAVAGPKAVIAPIDISELFDYRFSAQVIKVLEASTNAPLSAVGILAQLGGGLDSASPVTGSRSLLLYGIPGNFMTVTKASDAGLIFANAFVPLPAGARICTRAANGQIGELLIGSSNSQITTFVNDQLGPPNVCAT